VAAKRCLAATEPGYLASLSEDSRRSLALQGGAMSPDEAARFVARPWAADAIRLRRWDEAAKRPGAHTLPLEDLARALEACARHG
jgi:predicted HD phosphohydrolase